MTLTYKYGSSLYLNITNRCNCSCEFCIRLENSGVGDGDNLWLERDPAAAEVISELKTRNLSLHGEAVFCGFGEPTENLAVMLETCRWLKSEAPHMPIRLNTNGLCELSLQKPVAPLLKGLVDIISISLNAPDAQRYQEITRSAFGEEAFAAMLEFAASCKKYVPEIMFSVVDVLTDDEISRCRKIADSMEIPLRVRNKT